jgi:hypothetical protein
MQVAGNRVNQLAEEVQQWRSGDGAGRSSEADLAVIEFDNGENRRIVDVAVPQIGYVSKPGGNGDSGHSG